MALRILIKMRLWRDMEEPRRVCRVVQHRPAVDTVPAVFLVAYFRQHVAFHVTREPKHELEPDVPETSRTDWCSFLDPGIAGR